MLCAALASQSQFAAGTPASAEPDLAAQEREVAKLEAEQRRLLGQIKRELASLPESPSSSASASQIYVNRRAELMRLLAEIERRIDAEPTVRTKYVSGLTDEPAVRAYYERVQSRIEQQGTGNFPKANGAAQYGQVIITFAISSLGKIERAEVQKSSSDMLSKHSIKILRQLEPFERFPPEVAKSFDRMVITVPFNYQHVE
jgi:protein TonB